jgi:hypothetical protein
MPPLFGRHGFKIKAYGFPNVRHGHIKRFALRVTAFKPRTEGVIAVLILSRMTLSLQDFIAVVF